MKIKMILQGILVITLCACQQEFVTYKIIEKPLFSQEISLDADSLRIEEVINPIHWGKYENQIVVHNFSDTDSSIYLFSFPEFRYKNKFIRKGQGPGEYLSVRWVDGSIENQVSLYDIPNSRLRSYTLCGDSLLLKRQYALNEKIKGTNLTKAYLDIIQVNDSIFILHALDAKTDELTVNNLMSGELMHHVKNPKRNKKLKNYDYYGGMRYGNHHIIKYYDSMKRLEIYFLDENFMIIPKAIIGNSEMQKNHVYYYKDVFCSSNYIFALYSGSDFNFPGNSNIEVYDYEGNAIGIILLHRPISMILLDEKENKIYGYDENAGFDYVYRYTIPSFPATDCL